ncbi:MAG TPA: TAXI family TRAP transporter solute-binding subunit [Syntrophales bacterium]|nr:TAXI family TRAP transporter solute-binding subunit [Syntrophales bacterium]HPO36082.1 TAXI family TRAP transporter solute-binding subunit [Syntrophales bacterium]
MKKHTFVVVGLLLVFGFSLTFVSPVQGEVLKNAKFLSGPTGTTWYAQAAAFSGIAKNKLGMNVDVLTGSAISNPIQIERGKVQLALTFSSVLPFMAKGVVVTTIGSEAYFKEPLKKTSILCYTTTAAPVLIVDASSPYHKISDLKGKKIRFITYPPGFNARIVPDEILQAHGITHESIKQAGGKIDIVSKYAEACDLLAKGHADVISYIMAINAPAANLQELEAQKKFRILELDFKAVSQILKEMPLMVTTVKKGLHKSIEKDTTVLGDITTWIVPSDLPAETATAILDTLVKNMDTMAQVGNSEFKGFTAKELSRLYGKGTQLPLHPAALKFYKDHKAIR